MEEAVHDGTLTGEDLKKSLGAFLSTVGPPPSPPPPPVFLAAAESEEVFLASVEFATKVVLGTGAEKLNVVLPKSAPFDAICVVAAAAEDTTANGCGAEKLNTCVDDVFNDEEKEDDVGVGGAPNKNTV